ELAPEGFGRDLRPETAHEASIEAGEGRDLVAQPVERLRVALALQLVHEKIRRRVALDILHIGASHGAFRLARHGRHAGKARDILQEARAPEFAEVEERRNEDQAANADALVLLQVPDGARPPDAAIAFAQN